MTLKAVEFIRRFLLHVLPAGFVRIRHYGFLANRVCRDKLELCRILLAAIAPPVATEPVPEPKKAGEGRPEAHTCPACGEGRMVIIETLKAIPVQSRGRVEQGSAAEMATIDHVVNRPREERVTF